MAVGDTDEDFDQLAREADLRAEDDEPDWRRLAIVLFALERTIMNRALARARDDAGILRVFVAALESYRSAFGAFRRRWEDRALALMRTQSEAIAVRFGQPLPLRAGVVAMLDTRARDLADHVTAASAQRVEAVARVVAQEISDRRSGVVPVPAPRDRVLVGPAPPGTTPRSPLSDIATQQRLDTLVPLIGRPMAERVLQVVRDGRLAGRSMAKVASELVSTVHSLSDDRARATRIARTETIGLANATEFALASSRSFLTEKRWLDQQDGRVRDSHARNGRQGWIPMDQRFDNGLLYPGERPAPPEEVIQCRCSCAFRA